MSRSDDSIAARLSRGLKASLSAKAVYMGANAALVVLLSRTFLEPASFGRLFFALSVLGIVKLFASLGLSKSAARYVTEYVEQDDTQVRYILRRSTLYLAGVVGTVTITFAAVSGPLARWLGEPAVAPLLLVGTVYVVAYSFQSHFATLFQGFNRVPMSATLTVVSGIGRVSFAIAFVVAGLGALGALLGYVVGAVLAAAVGAVVIYRQYYTAFPVADRPERGLSRRLLKYSVPLTATKGAGVLDKKVDTILVGTLINPTAVGFYVIAKQVSSVVVVPASSFGFTVSPTYGEQKASGETSRAAELYREALSHTLLFYVPATAGLILVAEPMIRLVFGAEYLGAVPVVQVMAGFVLVNAVNRITTHGLDYLGRARERATLKGAMAVANVVLNLLLIPVLGVAGAAVATVITHTVYTLGNVYVIHQELTVPFEEILPDVGTVCLITVGMSGAVFVALPYISGVATLAGVVVFGGSIWAVLSVVSGLLDVERVVSFLL